MMTGPYKQNQAPPRQMPPADRLLPVLQHMAPPQGFAAVFESCLHAAADQRPTAQEVMVQLSPPEGVAVGG